MLRKAIFFACLLAMSYCSANAQTNQTITNGSATTPVSFPNTGCIYNWTNSNPGIGLPAAGTGNISSFTAINNGNTPVTATITATPVQAGFAYIANNGNDNVSVINTATNTVVATIKVGQLPGGVSLSPNSKSLYVSNYTDNSVSVINTSTNTVTATIAVDKGPHGITVSPDGTRVYVVCTTSNDVSVINAATNTVIATIPVGLVPEGIAVSPDGSKIYVADWNDGYLWAIDAVSFNTLYKVNIPYYSYAVTVTSDGSKIYVTNYTSNQVTVVNASNYQVINTIQLQNFAEPEQILISPDGSKLYVANTVTDNISVISTTTNAILANISLGTGVIGGGNISISPDGGRIYATETNLNSVAVISTASNTVIATIPVGSNPLSFGNFVSGTSPCSASPVTFTITVNPATAIISTSGSLSGLNTTQGTASSSASFSISGSGMAAGILVTPPVGFEVSTDNSTFSSTVTMGAAGTIAPTSVYVRLSAAAAVGSYSGDIVLSSLGAVNVNVPTVASTVVGQPVMTLSKITGSISACAGSPSAVAHSPAFTISGNYLTSNVSVTAPAGFEVSLSSGSGYAGNVTIVPSAGKLSNSAVYVRLSALATPGNNSGNIVVASGSLSQNIALAGTVNSLPTVNAVANQTVADSAATVAINFSGTGNTFSWTNDTPGIGLPANGYDNIAPFTAINNGSAPITATITAMPLSVGLAYIANKNDNTVSVINTESNTVIATIPVGTNPMGVGVSPDGTRAYVANFGSGSVSVINAAANAVIATIPVVLPNCAAVSPDGAKVYITGDSNLVTVIDAATNTVAATIPVGAGPAGIAVSPDGSRAYVANYTSKNVSVINTATNTVIATVTASYNPNGIVVSPDGKRVYVSDDYSYMSVIDATNNTLITNQVVLSESAGIAISPDGKIVYVLEVNNNTVLGINSADYSIVSSVTVGGKPTGIAISADGNRLYVTNAASGSVSVISTASNTVVSTIAVGSGPYSIGNFITNGTGCSGSSVKFTITVQPHAPAITAGALLGNISSCAGSASVSPYIGQFIVSGNNLASNITATAPANFEVSLAETSGYGNSISIIQAAGKVNNITVYVRVSASAAVGNITGNIVLTSSGAKTQNVAVSGKVNSLPTISPVANQTFKNGVASTSIYFSGTGSAKYVWTNSNPAIGLAASGTNYIPSFTAVNKGTSPVTATITATTLSNSTEFAYIPNYGSNTVSVIDGVNYAVVATIPVGTNPYGVAVSTDGSRAYVANEGSNSVSVINTATNSVISTISVGSKPHGIALSTDGSRAYVANYMGSNVSVINTLTNTTIGTVQTGGTPEGIVVSPDGSRVYVSLQNGGNITVINTANNSVVATIGNQTPQSPYGIAISPDGSRLYLAGNNTNGITVVNTATNTVVTNVFTGGDGPQGIAVSPDGSLVYVTHFGTANVEVMSTKTNTMVSNIFVGNNGHGVAVSADGSKLYVANYDDGTVWVIDAVTHGLLKVITVGSNPVGYGRFLAQSITCDSAPVTFTITVNPTNLSPENFKVSVTSATCKGSNNGSIGITAEQSMPYTVQVTGPGSFSKSFSFTDSLRITDLIPGVYNTCISLPSDTDFHRCYDLNVTEPKDLSLYSSIQPSTGMMTLDLSGADSYHVELNDVPYSTTANQLRLQLNSGANKLKIYSDKLCQGVIEKIVNFNKITLYPDPFTDHVSIDLGGSPERTVNVKVSTVSGKVIYNQDQANQSGSLEVNLPGLMTGQYILTLTLGQSQSAFKIIKQ
jgi:YVTN family beta-propeller protein